MSRTRIEALPWFSPHFCHEVFDVYRYTWKAYPKLQPLPPEQWASFRQGPHDTSQQQWFRGNTEKGRSFKLVWLQMCIYFVLFSSCQLKLARFYISCPACLLPPPSACSSSAGPEPRAPDQSGPRPTPSVSSGLECCPRTKNFRRI